MDYHTLCEIASSLLQRKFLVYDKLNIFARHSLRARSMKNKQFTPPILTNYLDNYICISAGWVRDDIYRSIFPALHLEISSHLDSL